MQKCNMKKYSIFFIFLMVNTPCRSVNILANFARDYYKDRNIQQIVTFNCWDPYDKLLFARHVMQMDTRMSFVPIMQDLDMKKILAVNYYHIGVVLDIDCPQSTIVFEQFSQHRLPFNESYHWLVLTEAITIPTDILKNIPFSVESEMTLASRQQDSYVLHDVYNPSYRHNGQLNITWKGSWTPRQGLDDELTQYKYIRRGNFHGLTLNFSIVVWKSRFAR